MNDAEILARAREILHLKGWTQRVVARDANGVLVQPEWPSACQFCSVGAIRAVGAESNKRAFSYLSRAIQLQEGAEASGIIAWNDAPGRTKDEVLSAFSLAVEIAERESRDL